MTPEPDKAARAHLLKLLDWHDAHVDFDTVVARWRADFRGQKLNNAPHTAWELLEHMRLAQWDILDFCRNPEYQEKSFPDDYWPPTSAPPDDAAWTKSVADFQRDREELKKLVLNEKTGLFAPLPHGSGQTLFREILLVTDHNSYHIGQLVQLGRLLGVLG